MIHVVACRYGRGHSSLSPYTSFLGTMQLLLSLISRHLCRHGSKYHRSTVCSRIGATKNCSPQLPYTKSCACSMHVTCIIQVVTCIILGTCHVHVPFYLHACSTHISCNAWIWNVFHACCMTCMYHAYNNFGLKIIFQSAQLS
jgi:hypothetical protein